MRPMPQYITGVENGEWTVDAKRIALVQRMVKQYINGQSLQGIAKELNAESGKTIRDTAIKYILTNKALIGTWTFKGVEYPNYLPAIITEKQFALLQDKLTHNHTRKGRNDSVTNLFRGLAFCNECGGPVGIVSKMVKPDGSTYNYFGCYNAARKGTCTAKGKVNAGKLEQSTFGHCINTSSSQLIANDTKTQVAAIEAIKGQLNTLDKKASKVAAMLDDDSTDLEEIKALSATIKEQRNNLNAELKAVEAKKNLAACIPENVQEFLTLIAKDTNNEDTRKALLNVLPLVVSKVAFYLNTNPCFEVTFRSGVKWSNAETIKTHTPASQKRQLNNRHQCTAIVLG